MAVLYECDVFLSKDLAVRTFVADEEMKKIIEKINSSRLLDVITKDIVQYLYIFNCQGLAFDSCSNSSADTSE